MLSVVTPDSANAIDFNRLRTALGAIQLSLVVASVGLLSP